MKFILAPDSFKGSLSALQAAEAMKRGVLAAVPGAETAIVPMADGGEGFVEAIVRALGGETVGVEVKDPLGRPVLAHFGLIEEGGTAVIEMAAASGLPLVEASLRNPLHATTYGTGQLIVAALDRGCRKILLGLGGSATNDAGAGMAQALGYRLLDEAGRELPPGGDNALWMSVRSIDGGRRDSRLAETQFIAACDVDALLYGSNGASAVFGPQKGATPEMVAVLDEALRQMAAAMERDLGVDVHGLAGGGAAGGLGAAMTAFCGARLQKGIELVLDVCRFEQQLAQADLVITGEGNTDGQTAMGKTAMGVAERAGQQGVPTICLSGGLGAGYETLRGLGMAALFSMMPRPATLEEAMREAEAWLEQAAREIAALYALGRSSRGM